MYSIGFPNMFNGSTIYLKSDYEAVKSNLKALLMSERGSLFGDPHYGLELKRVLWGQADKDYLLTKEYLKDEIFNAIYSYMPQVSVTRDDIDIVVEGNNVSATISVMSDSGIKSDLLKIDILTESE